MGKREHQKLLTKYPWLARRGRGLMMDGPDKLMKRSWHHRWRAEMRRLLHRDRDQDTTVYPKRRGDIWDWF
jgi:hypothetical protein